jgi:hypothetical protein
MPLTTSYTATPLSTKVGSTGRSSGRSTRSTLLLAQVEATSSAPSTPRCIAAPSTPTSRSRLCLCSSRTTRLRTTTRPSLRIRPRHPSISLATLSTIHGGLRMNNRLRQHPLLDLLLQSTTVLPAPGPQLRDTPVAPCSGSLLSLSLPHLSISLTTMDCLHTHPSTTPLSGTSTVPTVDAVTAHNDMRRTSCQPAMDPKPLPSNCYRSLV